MEKIIGRAVLFLVLFFGLFFGLQQIDWMTIFKVKETTNSTEEKFGDLIWGTIKDSEEVITEDYITDVVDSLIIVICEANDIDESELKVHIINTSAINAFALPNNHLIIYSGLIINCENEAELCGVVSHELAHLQLNHVMKKMVKEIGLATIVGATTGNGGSNTAIESLSHLTSTAYDRSLEEEADLKAVDYLIEAKIDPEPLANFMYKLGGENSELSQYMAWVNTHPNSMERSEYIIIYSLTKEIEIVPILSDSTWGKLKMDLIMY